MTDDASLGLMLAGDLMCGRGIDQALAHPGDPRLYEAVVTDARDYVRFAEAVHGPIRAPIKVDEVWGDALPSMRAAGPHLRIVNLETAVSHRGSPCPEKGIHYRMNPANAGLLQAGGIDVCILSNNHVLDWGRIALTDTIDTLKKAGIQASGAGPDSISAWSPARLTLPRGGRWLVFGLAVASAGIPAAWRAGQGRPGLAWVSSPSPESARRLIGAILNERLPQDRVLLSIHWGGNWGLHVEQAHRDFAHQLIDADAVDVVHGHSSHHPLPIELYRGKLILYGCGDLLNDYEGIGLPANLRSDVACLYFLKLSADDGQLRQLRIVPFRIHRFRLMAAGESINASLTQVFASAPLALGTQPRRVGKAEWQLQVCGTA